MRNAAVGFQCPECIAEGARATRSGLTAYGGRRSANPGLTSLVLIGANAAVWLVIAVSGSGEASWIARLGLHARGVCLSADGAAMYAIEGVAQCRALVGGTRYAGVADGAWWQLLTSMFTHAWLVHLAFNMLALWVLGPQLEAVVGRLRFLALYLLSGLAGSVGVYWLSDPYVPTIGASGATFGLMGALLVVALRVRGNVQGILVWIGINVVITVVGSQFISWQGHAGGLLGGLLIGAALVYAPRAARTRWQAAGLGGLAVALAVLTVARTVQLG